MCTVWAAHEGEVSDMSMASSAQTQEAAIVLICLKCLYRVFCSMSKTFTLTPAYLITNYVCESSVLKHRPFKRIHFH